jgi:hypothetical protein
MILTYVIFSVLNVIIQTIKSIVTIKCDKWVASVVNAVAYGLYTYIIVLTNADINLWLKIIVVALANLIGVFIVKYFEEKNRKDKLWKIECTIPTEYTEAVDFDLMSVPHSYITISNKHTLFNFYCATQKDTQKVKDITSQYCAKYFVSEAKTSVL